MDGYTFASADGAAVFGVLIFGGLFAFLLAAAASVRRRK